MLPKVIGLDNEKRRDIFNFEKLPELFQGTKVNIDLYFKNKFYDKNVNAK